MGVLDEPFVLDVFSVFIIKVYLTVIRGIRAVMVQYHDPFRRFVIP